jgi:hypothetical protein
MSTGADSKTMPVSREYEDGFDRTFGKRDPVRGRWIYLGMTARRVVRAEEYAPPAEEALNAPICAGSFYENTAATTCDEQSRVLKVDIGTRQRHREFMRQRGLTTADDYTKTWEQAAKERKQFFQDGGDRKERKEQIGRIAYELRSKNARRG